MFNKEENIRIKKVELNNKDIYKQYDNISITPFFVIMLNKYYEDKKTQDHLDLDSKIKLYYDRRFEYSEKKQYNLIISNLYHNGKIKINNEEYNLKDFYIVYKEDNVFHLICTNKKYPNKDIEYNKSVKFIDTTAFIELVNNYEIIETTIIVSSIDELENIISNWNGLLHDKVSETDAIINKVMIGTDQDGE